MEINQGLSILWSILPCFFPRALIFSSSEICYDIWSIKYLMTNLKFLPLDIILMQIGIGFRQLLELFPKDLGGSCCLVRTLLFTSWKYEQGLPCSGKCARSTSSIWMILLVPIELALVSQVFFCRITSDFTQCKVGGLSGALECSCPLVPFPAISLPLSSYFCFIVLIWIAGPDICSRRLNPHVSPLCNLRSSA